MDNVWPDDRNIKWYKGTPDMDNVHYCSTVEEAESEIDDAIIMEQEQVIEKFRDALLASTTLLNMIHESPAWHLVPAAGPQIEANQNLINAFK